MHIDCLEAARLVEKLAHRHGSNTKHLGWKASILPLDNERLNCATCRFKRELSRGKKYTHFRITLAHRKCNERLNKVV